MTAPTKTPRPGDQPLPQPGVGPSMHDLVCAELDTDYVAPAARHASDDLRARRQVGLDRYGMILQAHNGRDSWRDLYEEIQDAVVYARQHMEEADTPALRCGAAATGNRDARHLP